VDLSRALRTRGRECLVLSSVYNATVIPLCAAGLLSPVAAAGLALIEATLLCGNAARLLTGPRLRGPLSFPPERPPGLPATGGLPRVRTDTGVPLTP
jgi:hypothetical protein